MQFYLLDDRLCFTAEPGKVDDVRYIPLDRIPVRALPRGYGPQIGVSVVEDRYTLYPSPLFQQPGALLPEQYLMPPAMLRQVDKQDLGQSGRRHASVFSVQCGTHTHFMAAETAAEAEVIRILMLVAHRSAQFSHVSYRSDWQRLCSRQRTLHYHHLLS